MFTLLSFVLSFSLSLFAQSPEILSDQQRQEATSAIEQHLSQKWDDYDELDAEIQCEDYLEGDNNVALCQVSFIDYSSANPDDWDAPLNSMNYPHCVYLFEYNFSSKELTATGGGCD